MLTTAIIELLLFGALLPDGWESSSNVSTINRSFPSSKNPHFGNQAKCKTFLVSFAREETIPYISMVSHLASFWNRRLEQFGNGLFDQSSTKTKTIWTIYFISIYGEISLYGILITVGLHIISWNLDPDRHSVHRVILPCHLLTHVTIYPRNQSNESITDILSKSI